MADIILSLSEQDYERAQRIARAGHFESAEDYLNHVIREAIKNDAQDLGE